MAIKYFADLRQFIGTQMQAVHHPMLAGAQAGIGPLPESLELPQSPAMPALHHMCVM